MPFLFLFQGRLPFGKLPEFGCLLISINLMHLFYLPPLQFSILLTATPQLKESYGESNYHNNILYFLVEEHSAQYYQDFFGRNNKGFLIFLALPLVTVIWFHIGTVSSLKNQHFYKIIFEISIIAQNQPTFRAFLLPSGPSKPKFLSGHSYKYTHPKSGSDHWFSSSPTGKQYLLPLLFR